LHEAVDTTTPNGRLVFGIFATIAEFERELIRDRVRSGLAAARARGKKLGRPAKVLDASRIGALRAAGTPWRTIADQLGLSVPPRKKCRWCGKPVTKLCDFGTASGTCDAPMCDAHAKRVGEDTDYCPDHGARRMT